MAKRINVTCIKWGTVYSEADVNRLHRAVRRNSSDTYELSFYCFTDNATGFDPQIIAKPLPEMRLPAGVTPKHGYRKEAGLCDDTLGGLAGQRVLFFDLDTLIVGRLDEFFDMPKGDEFWIIKDWDYGERVGGAAVYTWVVGTLGYVKADFEADPEKFYRQYGSAAQEFLSDKVVERHGRMHFWPESWCVSFKRHCLPPWYKRRFVMARIPSRDVKAIIFHGTPKLEDASRGVWDSKHRVPLLKRIYKTLRPVDWIETYWKL